MRTYYLGPDALVTDDRFVWRSTGRAFAVRELRQIRLVRRHAATAERRVVTVTSAALAVSAGAFWVTTGPVLGAALGSLAAVALLLAFVAPRTRTVHVWALQASCRGVGVTLFESTDERVFNQVARALRRSVEDEGWRREEFGLAAA